MSDAADQQVDDQLIDEHADVLTFLELALGVAQIQARRQLVEFGALGSS